MTASIDSGEEAAAGGHETQGHDHLSAHDHHHDWRSDSYVSEWIAKDRGRADERERLLTQMLASAPFEKSRKLRVLDVGGGYGAVTEQTLRRFPNAEVTLQDFSEQMIDQAKRHLAAYGNSLRFVICDLRDRSWKDRVGGPFDLIVSAIAVHNVREMAKIAACYQDIQSLLAPGGCFLDCDHFGRAGGLAAHIAALRAAGFSRVDTIWDNGVTATLRAC
jgi:SAM-dependent methyltransferase